MKYKRYTPVIVKRGLFKGFAGYAQASENGGFVSVKLVDYHGESKLATIPINFLIGLDDPIKPGKENDAD